MSAAVGIHRARRPQVILIQQPHPTSIRRDLSYGDWHCDPETAKRGLVEDHFDVVALVEMNRIDEPHLPVVQSENQ
jgi:hypothetical protein